MRHLPFSQSQVEELAKTHPTPFYIYDEAGIRATAREFRAAFGRLPGWRNYFAVKALPNPRILKILAEEGMGADCSSLPELLLAERVGLRGEQIIFTSNDTPAAEFAKAAELGAIVNFDDLTHIEFFEREVGPLPELVCLRYNPGELKSGNALIGNPSEAKYGLTRAQILTACELLLGKGVKRLGLHTMVASNELNPDYFIETARIVFELAAEIVKMSGSKLALVDLGGGIGIPYRPEQIKVDLERVATGIAEEWEKAGQPAESIVLECGRAITGPHGYLVSRALHRKDTYKNYIGLDACMANLMRPALYGAYHHISVLDKEAQPATKTYDIVGSLCENNDKFAIDRALPPIEIGDLLVIHDSGAHGHAMGFNYNGKLRSAEFLLKENGEFALIRRAETVDDYFATLV